MIKIGIEETARYRMLNRQRCLLHMVERAGRPVTHLELTKWAFLLAHEMPSGGGRSFYQFLPSRLGPFSFSLYQEVRALVRNGYLTDSKVNGRDGWKIVQDVHRPTGEVPQLIRSDVARVVAHFRDMSTDGLLKYVYHRFPWFTRFGGRCVICRPQHIEYLILLEVQVVMAGGNGLSAVLTLHPRRGFKELPMILHTDNLYPHNIPLLNEGQ